MGEEYVPSPEEIKQAEDSMTFEQRVGSAVYEAYTAKIEDIWGDKKLSGNAAKFRDRKSFDAMKLAGDVHQRLCEELGSEKNPFLLLAEEEALYLIREEHNISSATPNINIELLVAKSTLVAFKTLKLRLGEVTEWFDTVTQIPEHFDEQARRIVQAGRSLRKLGYGNIEPEDIVSEIKRSYRDDIIEDHENPMAWRYIGTPEYHARLKKENEEKNRSQGFDIWEHARRLVGDQASVFKESTDERTLRQVTALRYRLGVSRLDEYSVSAYGCDFGLTENVIGSGSCGIVLEAVDRNSGERVACKMFVNAYERPFEGTEGEFNKPTEDVWRRNARSEMETVKKLRNTETAEEHLPLLNLSGPVGDSEARVPYYVMNILSKPRYAQGEGFTSVGEGNSNDWRTDLSLMGLYLETANLVFGYMPADSQWGVNTFLDLDEHKTVLIDYGVTHQELKEANLQIFSARMIGRLGRSPIFNGRYSKREVNSEFLLNSVLDRGRSDYQERTDRILKENLRIIEEEIDSLRDRSTSDEQQRYLRDMRDLARRTYAMSNNDGVIDADLARDYVEFSELPVPYPVDF